MPQVDIPVGNVIVLSDRPHIMRWSIPASITRTRVTCVEALEHKLAETDSPVVVIDERAYRNCDLEALIMDLAEFNNDRVAGIIVMTSPGHGPNMPLRIAGTNRFITSDTDLAWFEQMIAEARLERLNQRAIHHSDMPF